LYFASVPFKSFRANDPFQFRSHLHLKHLPDKCVGIKQERNIDISPNQITVREEKAFLNFSMLTQK
jgi:hypothetical protein